MSKKESAYYRCYCKVIPGSKYKEVAKIARRILNDIASRSKRRPYIRSAYFGGEKIFLDNFWPHLEQKEFSDRKKRLKLLPCSIELIQSSSVPPVSKRSLTQNKGKYYRFLGKINEQLFAVQIKEDEKRKQKFFMSCFFCKRK